MSGAATTAVSATEAHAVARAPGSVVAHSAHAIHVEGSGAKIQRAAFGRNHEVETQCSRKSGQQGHD